MSDIPALRCALAGLLAQRQRLDVVGHSEADVSTPGLLRQRADVVSGGSAPVPVLDVFREDCLIGERAASSQLDLQSRFFDRIELIHAEPSDSGLLARLDQLWSAFDELANHPSEILRRTAVLEQAEVTVDQFRLMDDQLRRLRQTVVDEAGELVARVNDLAAEFAAFDDSLRPLLPSDAASNDLLDRGDLALGRLADLVGGRLQVREDGRVDVYVGESTLEQGGRSIELESSTAVDVSLADVGVPRLVLRWKAGGEVAPAGGQAAGLLEMANTAVPNAIRALDGVASSLVTSVNAIHCAAQDLDGETGRNFFEPTGTTAATLAMSADVTGQPRHVSIATVGGGQLDAGMGQQIADLRDATGGADDMYVALVGELGVQVGSARTRAAAQQAVLRSADEARLAERTAGIDEEMIDLVSAQRGRHAAARAINAVDEMLDILVNRLGLVGR